MGEVYRAEDINLKRHVALKLLPPEVAASQDKLERFQREAETLAALDHPNIVTLYSVEEADGTRIAATSNLGPTLEDIVFDATRLGETVGLHNMPALPALGACSTRFATSRRHWMPC